MISSTVQKSPLRSGCLRLEIKSVPSTKLSCESKSRKNPDCRRGQAQLDLATLSADTSPEYFRCHQGLLRRSRELDGCRIQNVCALQKRTVIAIKGKSHESIDQRRVHECQAQVGICSARHGQVGFQRLSRARQSQPQKAQ